MKITISALRGVFLRHRGISPAHRALYHPSPVISSPHSAIDPPQPVVHTLPTDVSEGGSVVSTPRPVVYRTKTAIYHPHPAIDHPRGAIYRAQKVIFIPVRTPYAQLIGETPFAAYAPSASPREKKIDRIVPAERL
jgi:hypothetical protein